MSIQNWSDSILVVDLCDDPAFGEEINTLQEACQQHPHDVVLNFGAVDFINSSNISKLLRLRKLLISQHRRLIFCGVSSQVWGVFILTGLDKIFVFTSDISTSLATLQMSQN